MTRPVTAREDTAAPSEREPMSETINDHRATDKPADSRRGRWSWAFMRRDRSDGPGRKWSTNRFLIGKPGNPMMERWRLIQTPLFGVYLHRIYREDLDPVAHDHPWRFRSLVLRGGYTEQLFRLPQDAASHGELVAHRRGSVHAFPLHHAHRIVRVAPGTVTLVVVGRKVRTWGFWSADGWTEWQDALGLRPTEGARSTGKYPR